MRRAGSQGRGASRTEVGGAGRMGGVGSPGGDSRQGWVETLNAETGEGGGRGWRQSPKPASKKEGAFLAW